MKLKTILLGAAAFAWLVGRLFAQERQAPPLLPIRPRSTTTTPIRLKSGSTHGADHPGAASRDSRPEGADRTGQRRPSARAAAAPPQPQPEVSGAQFEALQNQILKQAAENKSHAWSPSRRAGDDGRPTGNIRCPIISLVQADAATFDDAPSRRKAPRLSRSGFNFRRARSESRACWSDFDYKFTMISVARAQESGAENIITGTTPPTVAVNPSGARIQSPLSHTGDSRSVHFKIGAFPTPAKSCRCDRSRRPVANERPRRATVARAGCR